MGCLFFGVRQIAIAKEHGRQTAWWHAMQFECAWAVCKGPHPCIDNSLVSSEMQGHGFLASA